MSKYAALFTSVNLLLGVGPLILPMPFFDAGILLSTIWMVLISLLSYNSAMFIAESMNKVTEYAIDNQQRSSLTVRDSLISSQEHDLPPQQANAMLEGPKVEVDHMNQFEIMFGEKWGFFPCLAISIYLLGTAISKCIMTGKTMKTVFQEVDVLNRFQFWVFLFFISGACFSFRSIDKTKVMQVLIIGMRVISILMFFIGAIYLFSTNGIKKLVPVDGGLANFEQFVELFSNSVFSLMFHHSLPNIVNSLKDTSEVRFVIRNAFLISGTVLIVIPVTGIMAFGNTLGNAHDHLKYYNLDFKGQIDFVYWFTSFYVFLNVAAFSVYIIVIRSNLLHLCFPKVDPKKISKHTVISSIFILAFILLMSIVLKEQIQVVLNFTGGIFGIFILFLMPSIEVYKARKLTHTPGNPKNYIPWIPIAIGVLGIAFMGLNLFHIIKGLINDS